jgi:hypothetical protein
VYTITGKRADGTAISLTKTQSFAKSKAGATGGTGPAGDSIVIEYSVNGSTNWHSTFTAGDLYMRQKVGTNGTWSSAIKIIGTDANLLDWVQDWNTQTTTINTQKVLTPHLFAGQVNADTTVSGVAIGKDVLSGKTNNNIGIVSYLNNNPVFQVSIDGTVKIGKSGGSQITLDSNGYAVIPDITADKIKGGQLILGGANNANGQFFLKNGSGYDIITMNKDGINVSGASYTINDQRGIKCNAIPLPTLLTMPALITLRYSEMIQGVILSGMNLLLAQCFLGNLNMEI